MNENRLQSDRGVMTNCPQCSSENIYADGNLWICPECSHEWSQFVKADESESAQAVEPQGIRDSNGTPLADGDSVTVIKELKIKGASSVVKVGTKVRNIRLTPDGDDGHDISCKIDGLGSINLKSQFVRKV